MPDEFLDSLNAGESEARWAATVAKQTPWILVVEVRGEVLGACRFGASPDNDATTSTAEIYSLNVHPSSWGQGLGRGLLTEVVQRLPLLGFSHVTLWVLEGNTRARALYESFGFVVDGSQRTASDLTGVPLHEIRYSLALRGRLAAG
jgi:ribosomal protein S18 acetylase RimI-like enzyme